MPERDYVWLPRKDILDFEEVSVLVDVFADLGVDRVRLTGGEPLVRRDLPKLVRMIAAKPAIRDLAMTTNGVLLAENAAALKEAGLSRVTVSLDTLQPERFHTLTRFDDLPRVLKGIEVAAGMGFSAVKIDSVVIRGVNEEELVPLLEHGRKVGAEVRFIEYMDVGGATRWSRDKVVSRAEMLGTLARHYGPIRPLAEKTSAPAERFRLVRRDGLRDHRLDDGPLLRLLRPQPADRRRPLVPLPLRRARVEPGRASSGRLLAAGASGLDRGDLARADGPRRGRPAGAARPYRARSAHDAPARSASGNAHAGRVGSEESKVQGLRSKVGGREI